jgi:hypothetical protein
MENNLRKHSCKCISKRVFFVSVNFFFSSLWFLEFRIFTTEMEVVYINDLGVSRLKYLLSLNMNGDFCKFYSAIPRKYWGSRYISIGHSCLNAGPVHPLS